MAFLFTRPSYVPVHCRRPAPRHSVAVPPFFDLIDETLNELAKASRQQQREIRRTINPRFDVRETEDGYQVDAELPGIAQEDIEIEFSDDQTLVIKGRTGRPAQQQQQQQQSEAAPAVAPEEKQADENADEVTLAAADSDTASEKSHQATVEDDFEDLGHDSDVASTSDKGKARATEAEITEKPQEEAAVQQAQAEQAAQQEQYRRHISERRFGSFERSFKFPVRIHTETVTAQLRNGILSITMYKAPVPESRRIPVA